MNTLTAAGLPAYRNLFDDISVRQGDVWTTHAVLRANALQRFETLGFATVGREDWMFSDMGPLGQGTILPLSDNPDPGSRDLPVLVPDTDSYRLVFVNGRFRPALSDLTGLPEGVILQPLAYSRPGSGLGSVADFSESTPTALNTAFWRDGLYLAVAEGVTLERPVELYFITDADAGGMLVPVRNLIVAGSNSTLTIVEHFHGNTPAAQLPVTEVDCGAGATVRHIKLMRDASAVQHLGGTHVSQHADSVYQSWEIVLDGERTRRELHVALKEPGAVCELNALYMGDGDQRLDLRTRVDHAAADCRTTELYKGLLDGASRGVFDGLIHVARDSQRTAAFQTNRTLLLSDDAVANSIPRLEIYADDVKCSHGSTTGQLDEDQVFYLRTRGFSVAEARAHLAAAFAAEVLDTLPIARIREELTREITSRLHRGGAS